MLLQGDLGLMALPDLLQWIDTARRTGVLEIERNNVGRRIEFRTGLITACSSDDPPSRLGQFLLSRGKITEDQLRDALSCQEATGANLGRILVAAGALSPDELIRQVEGKAEETIRGLFDWEDAVFRFQQGATLDPDSMEIRLSVSEVLLRGLRHQDQLRRIRKVFSSGGIVLQATDQPAPRDLTDRAVVRRIVDAVDGRRTLAEILLHAHASAFVVLKVLHKLHQAGLVEIVEECALATDIPTILDRPVARTALEWSEPGTLAWLEGRDITDLEPPRRDRLPAPPVGGAVSDSVLDEEIDVATRLMAREEFAAALELLNATYRAHPGETHVRRLILRAEGAYVDSVGSHDLASSRVPVALPPGRTPARLGSEESFLLSLIDGESDIKSILWLAPLREVDVLRILQRMLDRGQILLLDPRLEACN